MVLCAFRKIIPFFSAYQFNGKKKKEWGDLCLNQRFAPHFRPETAVEPLIKNKALIRTQAMLRFFWGGWSFLNSLPPHITITQAPKLSLVRALTVSDQRHPAFDI